MDEALLAEYRASTYLVCLTTVQWSPIHIGAPLPDVLQTLADECAWGFLTAWNPGSHGRSTAENTAAQDELLAAVHAEPELLALYPGIGIGTAGWYEPSLFVIGPGLDTLDALCNRYAQNAYVYGHGHDLACLRLLRA